MVEEIPAVPWLDIDPALLILPVFGFSTYEIPSYDFGADVVPLQSLVERAMRENGQDPSSVLGLMGSQLLLQLWDFEKLQVMAPPLDHLMFDYRPQFYIHRQCHLIGETVEDWTTILRDLTFKGVRWTCPWWYINWPSRTTVPISNVADTSSSDLYRFWLQAYTGVGADSESADLLTVRFLLGAGM
ncbi:hypothetical protein JCGZ_22967 [Jatropha curcas]|uniref:Uncharacterized protein n=1 Tax=Jatropha curcas TaxID=180498 RepID=A0A067L8U7_JATCU|nr:hypothetical protein JCGZ_22967 [Jatropha curcas]